MASFLNTVNKLAKNIADQLDTDAKPGEASNDSPSKGAGAKVSLEKAPREDLIEFIKKQAVHTKKVESRLAELLEAYKKVSKEKLDIKTEFEDLSQKYKLLCDSKAENTSGTDGGESSESKEPNEGDSLEKLVARLEREREDLQRQLTAAQEAMRAQDRGAELEVEEYKAQVKQLNEKLNEKIQGVDAAIEEKIKQLNEKFSEEQERALKLEKEKDEIKAHLEAANVLVATLQKECDEAKDTFNILQKKAEDDKALEGRKMEAVQEELQSSFQAERDLLKGEIQKLMQEVATSGESFKQERNKLEEDMLNVELERRMLEEKLEEVKGNGEALFRKEWDEEKNQLTNELEEERDRVKKLSEELVWERERKDAFDKRLEGIENRGESERNRTLESEKRQLEIRIKELEATIADRENEIKGREEQLEGIENRGESEKRQLEIRIKELEEAIVDRENKIKGGEEVENRGESERNRALESEKQQLEIRVKELEEAIADRESKIKGGEEGSAEASQKLDEERKKFADLVREKEKLEELLAEQSAKHKEEIEKLDHGLSVQTKASEEAHKSKEELQQVITKLENKVKELEGEKEGLAEKLRLAEQAHHDNEQVQEYLEKIGEEKHVLATEVERLRQMLEDSKAERDETTTKLSSVTLQLEEFKQNSAEERKTLTESVNLGESQLVQQKEEKSRLESEIESLQAQVKDATTKLEQVENEKTELGKQLAKLKEQHEEEKSELARSSSAKNLGAETQAAEFETENSKLRSQKVELEAEIELMRKEADRHKEEHALMLAEKIQQISVLEQKLSEKGEGTEKEEGGEAKDKEREPTGDSGAHEDAGKLRNDLSEKEAELFQLRQELYAKEKAILESKALLEQSILQQAQLREDIADKDEQITHLKEAQEIQMKSVSASVANTAASEKELAEKLHKYRQLLIHAQTHINEQKLKLSDKQNDVFEYQKKLVSLNEELEKLKNDKTKFSEQNFMQLQKNYEQHCRTSKLRIDSLEQQLQSTSKDLNALRNEYQGYKKRAASALKTAAPTPAVSSSSSSSSTSLTRASDQEHLVRSLAQEIDSLKAGRLELEETKMHLYKLEADNAQLTKQVKQFSEQIAELEARLKTESTRLADEKKEISIRLSAQKDDLQQQFNLLEHNHKSIVKEKDEQISVLEHQVKLLQDEANMKSGAIQKLQQQVSESQTTPPTPRVSASPRIAHFQNYYSEDTGVEEENKYNKELNKFISHDKTLTRSVSNSSFGSADEGRSGRSTPHNSMDTGDQILYYAQLQALREEELAKSQAKLKEMNSALSEAEKMEKLHNMQEQVLKQEIRELQRAQKRESTNPEYLKNVIVKYIEFEDQQEKLLPVISTLLQLTPVEVKRLEEKRKSRSGLLAKVWGK